MSHKDQTSSMFVIPLTFDLLPAFLASGKCTVVLLIMEKIGIVKRWRCDSDRHTSTKHPSLSLALCSNHLISILVHVKHNARVAEVPEYQFSFSHYHFQPW